MIKFLNVLPVLISWRCHTCNKRQPVRNRWEQWLEYSCMSTELPYLFDSHTVQPEFYYWVQLLLGGQTRSLANNRSVSWKILIFCPMQMIKALSPLLSRFSGYVSPGFMHAGMPCNNFAVNPSLWGYVLKLYCAWQWINESKYL